MSEQPKTSEFDEDDFNDVNLQDEDQIELQMLTEECEQLINKIGFSMQLNLSANEEISEQAEEMFSIDIKKEKQRLEKEYLQLCVEIERQQKQLDNYKFKIKVSNKEAEYYTRQIKEKEEILQNLEKHQANNKKSRNSHKK